MTEELKCVFLKSMIIIDFYWVTIEILENPCKFKDNQQHNINKKAQINFRTKTSKRLI